jgi:hypothetical protein
MDCAPVYCWRFRPEKEEYDRDVRIEQVRHRSRATHSRQPRQVRKEATVTSSCVCSGSPVSGFFISLKSVRKSIQGPAEQLNSLVPTFSLNKLDIACPVRQNSKFISQLENS